ncbi:MAG: hypothetical protein H7122_10200 [Chitinophagaceae bacterium]|nr:hypothetical protein [Chitinophagaceae bacterium]
MNGWLILIPILSTFSGLLISRIAIVMLWHPVRVKKIAGMSFQGILPKRRAELTKQLVDIISEQLLSQKETVTKIVGEHQFEKLLPQIEHHIDEFLRFRLGKKMPMIGMFIGDNTIRQLKEVFMEELTEIFPSIMASYINGIQQHTDFRSDIAGKINSLPDTALKPVLRKAMSKDLWRIDLIGSIVGFLIGIIQAIIIISVT